MLARVALMLVVAVTGCASVERQILQSPAAGGAPWSQLTSEHFIVRTDYPEWAAKSALETFDISVRALIALALPAGTKPPRDRLDVVMFEHGDDFRALIGQEHLAGLFHYSTDGSRPMLVVSTDNGFVATFNRTRQYAQHEITHWLFRNAVPGMPLWLNEGIAKYWESLRLEDGQAIIGSLPQLDLLADWPRAADVMTAEPKSFYQEGGHRFYSAAWGMVYMLYTKHADAFARYLGALAGGARGEAAWRGAFGSFDARALDAEMRDWFAADRPGAHAVPLAIPARDFGAAKPIAPADVLVLWARLRPWQSDDKMLARTADELASAERLAPGSPSVQAYLALIELRRGQKSEAMARLDRALGEHPADAQLLRIKGELLLGDEMARPAAARDFAPLASLTAPLAEPNASAVSLRFAARVAAVSGDAARAIALAERAAAREPDCAACFDTLSLARQESGDVEGAVRAAETALRLLPDGATDRELSNRLAELKQSLRH